MPWTDLPFLRQSIHDPGRVSLRRGLRAAVVIPPLLALATSLHVSAPLSTFLIFGAMALLVFADFGGTSSSRVRAYVLTALAGVPLILVGSFAAANLWTAIAATALFGFAIAATGVLGGYFVSAQTALILALVLSVTSAASPADILQRTIGWILGGVAAALAGWLLWPRSSHVALSAKAAIVLRTLATLIEAPNSCAEQTQLAALARQELDALRAGFVVAQRRPSGATRRDRALAELASELDRTLTYSALSPAPSSSNAIPAAAALRSAVVRAVRGSAALLAGSNDVRDIEPLLSARDDHRAALDQWAAHELESGALPEVVLDGLIAAHPLRLMSMVALAIAQNAEIVAGAPTTGPGPHVRRDVWTVFREELTPSSVLLHSSLRTALGLTVAVLAARLLAVPFAFWVVLGTLSALRSNVSATGRSAVLALIGTAIGVLVAVPFVGVVSGESVWLWAALPILVFLAAYTPAAVHFVVGQAAFSMLVVVLFNILAPTGWEIGLVRVADAALGVSISAIVGLMLWPRGARGQLRSALAGLYQASAGSLAAIFRSVLSSGDESLETAFALHDDAHTEVIRAEEVFELFLSERSTQPPPVEVWAALLNGGKAFLIVGEVLDWLAKHGYAAAACGPPADRVGTVANDAIAHISRLAEEIRGGRSLLVTPPRDRSEELRGAALAALSAPAVLTSGEALRAAIGLAATADWLRQLDGLLQDLETPVASTQAASARAWWR